ncbi:hypothetical protein PR048_006048 [Dryococelus australis]|uniref:Uncharacterized protein n=1 Tax=Dryococelus australis TaxID=614101 RepID=A0ABQ9I9V5_9NEOP|nr:hypothetical protein PR048_006048 [Dryococelus australis]
MLGAWYRREASWHSPLPPGLETWTVTTASEKRRSLGLAGWSDACTKSACRPTASGESITSTCPSCAPTAKGSAPDPFAGRCTSYSTMPLRPRSGSVACTCDGTPTTFTTSTCAGNSPVMQQSRLLTSHHGEWGSIPCVVTRDFACGNRSGICRWSSGFLEVFLCPPSLHYAVAPSSSHFTIAGFQDLAIKGRPKHHYSQLRTLTLKKSPSVLDSKIDSCKSDLYKAATNREPALSRGAKERTMTVAPCREQVPERERERERESEILALPTTVPTRTSLSTANSKVGLLSLASSSVTSTEADALPPTTLGAFSLASTFMESEGRRSRSSAAWSRTVSQPVRGSTTKAPALSSSSYVNSLLSPCSDTLTSRSRRRHSHNTHYSPVTHTTEKCSMIGAALPRTCKIQYGPTCPQIITRTLQVSSHEAAVVKWLKYSPPHLGEPGSIPSGVAPGLPHSGIVPDDAADRRVFSGISRSPRPITPALLHTPLASPASALKTLRFRTTQISSLKYLVGVAGDDLQHAEAARQVLDDADVVQLRLEARQIVVDVAHLDLDARRRRLERVVELRRLQLQHEGVARERTLSFQVHLLLQKDGAVARVHREQATLVARHDVVAQRRVDRDVLVERRDRRVELQLLADLLSLRTHHRTYLHLHALISVHFSYFTNNFSKYSIGTMERLNAKRHEFHIRPITATCIPHLVEVKPRFLHVGDCGGPWSWSVGFFWVLPFPPELHSNATQPPQPHLIPTRILSTAGSWKKSTIAVTEDLKTKIWLNQESIPCPLEQESCVTSFGVGAAVAKRLTCMPASHQGEPGSIPGRVTEFPNVGVVPDDTVGRRVFSGISHFSHPFIPPLLLTHRNTLIGSQVLVVKSRPNLFTHSFTYSKSNKWRTCQDQEHFTSRKIPTSLEGRLIDLPQALDNRCHKCTAGAGERIRRVLDKHVCGHGRDVLLKDWLGATFVDEPCSLSSSHSLLLGRP